jgi:hypothetical protein
MDSDFAVSQYEFAVSAKQNVLITFIGQQHIPGKTRARIVGDDLLVERGGATALRFIGLEQKQLGNLLSAAKIYISRTMANFTEDYLSEVELVA